MQSAFVGAMRELYWASLVLALSAVTMPLNASLEARGARHARAATFGGRAGGVQPQLCQRLHSQAFRFDLRLSLECGLAARPG